MNVKKGGNLKGFDSVHWTEKERVCDWIWIDRCCWWRRKRQTLLRWRRDTLNGSLWFPFSTIGSPITTSFGLLFLAGSLFLALFLITILGFIIFQIIIINSHHRWGPQLEQATYKNRHRLYLSEQVSSLSFPHFLLSFFFFLSY